MKVVYIGGTGQISFDCVHETVRAGHETWVFNRGNSNAGLPAGVNYIQGDIEDDAAYGKIAEMGFDVICQFRVFTPEKMSRDIELFSGTTGQYIFISSASAYQKPLPGYPVTEEMPLVNPFARYSRDKADCEIMLRRQSQLPYTIVRPSHTSRTRLITAMGEADLAAHRMLRRRPVVIPGDGTSLWTITAARDFAPPFVRLFGNPKAINDYFHLTSDNVYTWNCIYGAIAEALGVELQRVHVPAATLVKYNPDWMGSLLGDKIYSAVFDNRKIKSVTGDFHCDTSLPDLMAELVADFLRRGGIEIDIDAAADALFDRIVAEQTALGE